MTKLKLAAKVNKKSYSRFCLEVFMRPAPFLAFAIYSLVIVVIVGCGSGSSNGKGSGSQQNNTQTKSTFSIIPSSATLEIGDTQQFSVSATNITVYDNWHIQEPNGGSIQQMNNGGALYMAPSTTGTYHVIATNYPYGTSSNSNASATATVTVTNPTTYQFNSVIGSAGNGSGQYNYPTGVAIDASGNIYVCDINSHILKYTSNGQFLTRWGTSGSGNGQFNSPRG